MCVCVSLCRDILARAEESRPPLDVFGRTLAAVVLLSNAAIYLWRCLMMWRLFLDRPFAQYLLSHLSFPTWSSPKQTKCCFFFSSFGTKSSDVASRLGWGSFFFFFYKYTMSVWNLYKLNRLNLANIAREISTKHPSNKHNDCVVVQKPRTGLALILYPSWMCVIWTGSPANFGWWNSSADCSACFI